MKDNYEELYNKMMVEGKKDYEIYHKTYTSAVAEMVSFAKKNGYTIDEDDMFSKVTTGPGRPKNGKTVKHNLELIKGGKTQKKLLHAQVYNRDTNDKTFELNMYIT